MSSSVEHTQESFMTIETNNEKPTLQNAIEYALRDYFHELDGTTPGNLYEMVLGEVEQPLLKAVLDYTRGNQSKAADVLGINRGTLRKKLKEYGLHG
ncbi:MAG: DNA-binding transcriptional regulator Fis [Gammaproteobacteria bacterium]|nr:DNA-binding transcriptional regulator Fis [Gammaproteobacteria bacterium]